MSLKEAVFKVFFNSNFTSFDCHYNFLGITKALFDKKSIQCACLATALNYP